MGLWDMSEARVSTIELRASVGTRAAVLVAPRRWEVQAGRLKAPGRGEIRVALEGCGVCASSLPAWQGREWFEYPMAAGQLGHEGWGRIDAVGEGVERSRLGERVALLADGAFATHVTVPAEESCVLPESLDALPMPAEPLACAFAIMRRADVQPGMRVAVVGSGFLGALLVQLLSRRGCEVVAISRRCFARETALRMGAVKTLSFGRPWEVADALGSGGAASFPRVIEAVGRQDALDLASALTAEGGRLVIAGFHQDGLRSINLQEWNWKGIDVINAHERDRKVIFDAMRDGVTAVAAGECDLNELLTQRYELAEIELAFQHLETRPDGFLKGWVDLQSTTRTTII